MFCLQLVSPRKEKKDELFRRYMLTESPSLMLSGCPMVFQGYLWVFIRLYAHFWTKTQTIFYGWLAHIYCVELNSHDP